MVRLTFPLRASAYFWDDASGFIMRPNTFLPKFDKRDYVGVDSAQLVVLLSTDNPNVEAITELYDATAGAVIAGTEARSRSTTQAWAESGNVYDRLPEEEITLGLRIRPSVSGTDIYLWAAYLFLYRSEEQPGGE